MMDYEGMDYSCWSVTVVAGVFDTHYNKFEEVFWS